MKNNSEKIAIRAGKPVTFFILMGFAGTLFLLGLLFSKVKIFKYGSLDEDRVTVYKMVCIEITELPVKLEMKSKERYYLGRGEESAYVILLSQKQIDAIKAAYERDGENFRYSIEGKTRGIFDNLQKASTQAYNEAAGSELITEVNYPEYFGETYVDATEGSAGTVISAVCYMLAALFTFIALMVLSEYFHGVHRIKKVISEYGREELERQINAPTSVVYPKAGVCLAEKYIITSAQGFDVVPYDEICWIYILKRRLNFVTITQIVTAATKSGRLVSVAAAYNEKLLQEVIGGIYAKHPSVWVGYTPENRKKYAAYLNSRR